MSSIRCNSHPRPSSIMQCDIQASCDEHDGVKKVMLRVQAYDHYDISAVVALIDLRPSEAISLAERLIKAAKEAEQ